MACGENESIVKFIGAIDYYANAVRWTIERKGVINPSFVVSGTVGNQSFSVPAENQDQIPLASCKVLLGLVVLSIAPTISPNLFNPEDEVS